MTALSQLLFLANLHCHGKRGELAIVLLMQICCNIICWWAVNCQFYHCSIWRYWYRQILSPIVWVLYVGSTLNLLNASCCTAILALTSWVIMFVLYWDYTRSRHLEHCTCSASAWCKVVSNICLITCYIVIIGLYVSWTLTFIPYLSVTISLSINLCNPTQYAYMRYSCLIIC